MVFRAWCDQPKCWPHEGQSWSSSYVADRHHGQGRSGLMGSCSMTSLDGSHLAAAPSNRAVNIANTSRLLSGQEATVESQCAGGKDFGGSRPGVGSGCADASLTISSARRRRFPFQTRSRLGLLTRLPWSCGYAVEFSDSRADWISSGIGRPRATRMENGSHVTTLPEP